MTYTWSALQGKTVLCEETPYGEVVSYIVSPKLRVQYLITKDRGHLYCFRFQDIVEVDTFLTVSEIYHVYRENLPELYENHIPITGRCVYTETPSYKGNTEDFSMDMETGALTGIGLRSPAGQYYDVPVSFFSGQKNGMFLIEDKRRQTPKPIEKTTKKQVKRV